VRPSGRNEPIAILGAWTALEALSPQTYRQAVDLVGGRDRRCIGSIDNGHLPWDQGRNIAPQIPALLQDCVWRGTHGFSDSCLDQGVWTRRGELSSFPWALPLALQLKFDQLSAWATVEANLLDGLEAILRRSDPDGNPIPLDWSTIDKAYRYLVQECGVATEMIEPPSFVLRHYHLQIKETSRNIPFAQFFLLGRPCSRVCAPP
jgi:hypothetical protein